MEAAAAPPEEEEAIQNLCTALGEPRDRVETAMRAAFKNADRAAQYLVDGIPAELQGAGAWEELAASPAFLAEVQGVSDKAALQSYLNGLRMSNPAQLALIQANQPAFAALLENARFRDITEARYDTAAA